MRIKLLKRGRRLLNQPKIRQIQEHQYLKKQLDKSNEFIINILDRISDPFFALDNNWRFTYVNKQAEIFFGYQKEELIGRNIWRFFPEDKNSKHFLEFHKALIEKLPRQFEYQASLTSEKYYEVNVYPSKEGLSICIRDISKRKKAEEALRFSEDKFSRIFNHSPVSITIVSLNDGKYVDVNPAFVRGTGYSKEEAIGKTPLELGIWSVSKDREHMIEMLKSRGEVNNQETSFQCKDGSILHTLLSVRIINFGGEDFILSFTRNINQRKQVEEALRISEEKFYKSFHLNPDIMSITSTETGEYIDVNQAFLDCSGYSRDEVIGHTSEELVFAPGIRQNLLTKLKQEGALKNIEIEALTKSRKTVNLLLSADFIDLLGKKYLISSAKDITEQKAMEKELSRLEMFKIISQMSASISHEVRNPMTTVKGFLQLLGEKEIYLKDKEFFSLMIDELDRANAIITNFLSLSQTKPNMLQLENLNEISGSLYPIIYAYMLEQNKNLKIQGGEIPNILLDKNEIRQLILNLVNNSIEAVSPGGTVTVKTYSEKDSVILEVRDDGNGIPKDIMNNLGTPFLTTKETGTGLGLSICYSIAKRHDAKIKVESSSSGTTFIIRFSVPKTA